MSDVPDKVGFGVQAVFEQAQEWHQLMEKHDNMSESCIATASVQKVYGDGVVRSLGRWFAAGQHATPVNSVYDQSASALLIRARVHAGFMCSPFYALYRPVISR